MFVGLHLHVISVFLIHATQNVVIFAEMIHVKTSLGNLVRIIYSFQILPFFLVTYTSFIQKKVLFDHPAQGLHRRIFVTMINYVVGSLLMRPYTESMV